ncbi:TraR/DksA family transcriptional regulator [Catellatospora tritici]|uniref:TraR/DksA family transcriptional regulator n=1 Tax=Catellatospora tritici TaxID=2851566 RepID=UPI001C2CD573|nr:TraR/DksA C4-type zinc finger protein [Catellatospora tritici]MBV1856478.1 TraR/DksA C4-type zinc finger protein [Catellatospora tritici]
MTVVAENLSMDGIGRLLQQRYEQAVEHINLESQARSELNFMQQGPGDIADAGSLASESAQHELVSAALQEQLHRLETALERWHAGTLGACQTCGGQIPLGRLELMPWAVHCVPCQSRADRGR